MFFKFNNSGRFAFISKYLFKRLLNIDNLFKSLVNDHFFLKYYNNNYRPIYHLESIFFEIVSHIKGYNIDV